MWWSPAWNNVIRFGQSWHTACKLREYLMCMEVPPARKDVVTLHGLQWLKRNLGIQNHQHHLYEEVMRLIRHLLTDDLYDAQLMIWGPM